MKKLFLILSILSGFFKVGYAQMYELKSSIDFFRQHKLASGEWKNVLTESDIEGSPYLNPEFINGVVYTLNKQKYIDIPLRFNAYNESIEFKSADGQILAIDTPELIEKVEFDGNTVVYLPFSNLKKIRKGLFIVLTEGKATLLRKPEVIFKEAVPPAAYQDAEPPKFIRKTDLFYLKTGSEQAKLIENRSDLIDFMKDKKSEIETFIKKNKTKINADDLIELVKYYNSL